MNLDSIKQNIRYLLTLPMSLSVQKINVSIKTIEQTIEYISIPKHSIVRFGDGEFSLMGGKNIYEYQKYDEKLAKYLEEVILYTNDENLLVSLPETLTDLKKFKRKSQKIWSINFGQNHTVYKKFCKSNYEYGNAFVSRPYMIYEDKSSSEKCFKRLINAFEGKDIVLIEGYYSRSGVGNNLFSKAHSLKRILCPNKNAFDKFDQILDATMQIDKNSLILVAIGPTSKPLCLNLVKRGYWVWDIGHIDSEYEWFLRRANSKEIIQGKHTAESLDSDIVDCVDKDYEKSILCTIK